jgi:hypothetical protein
VQGRSPAGGPVGGVPPQDFFFLGVGRRRDLTPRAVRIEAWPGCASRRMGYTRVQGPVLSAAEGQSPAGGPVGVGRTPGVQGRSPAGGPVGGVPPHATYSPGVGDGAGGKRRSFADRRVGRRLRRMSEVATARLGGPRDGRGGAPPGGQWGCPPTGFPSSWGGASARPHPPCRPD